MKCRCGVTLSQSNMELDSKERLVCRECYLRTVTMFEVEIVLAAVVIDTANDERRAAA